MHEQRTLVTVITFLCLLLSGCISIPNLRPDAVGIDALNRDVSATSMYASTASLPRKPPGELPPPYRVGANDEMTIFVMGRGELGSQVPVNAAGAFGQLRATIVQETGNIVMPLLGPMQVAGRTIEEIRELVESNYAQRIAESNVDIIMQDCRSQAVHVTGAVNLPATYYLCNDMSTLNDVLSAAQWLSPEAYPAGGVLTRDGETYQLGYPLHSNANRDLDILLRAGDSVYFPTIDDGILPKVHVFGMVRTQGTFPMPAEGMTLVEALGLAQGALNETASIDDVYLMRTRPGEETPTTYKLAFAEVYQGPSVALAPDDRIYVAPRNIARWDVWWRLAIPISISARAIGN